MLEMRKDPRFDLHLPLFPFSFFLLSFTSPHTAFSYNNGIHSLRGLDSPLVHFITLVSLLFLGLPQFTILPDRPTRTLPSLSPWVKSATSRSTSPLHLLHSILSSVPLQMSSKARCVSTSATSPKATTEDFGQQSPSSPLPVSSMACSSSCRSGLQHLSITLLLALPISKSIHVLGLWRTASRRLIPRFGHHRRPAACGRSPTHQMMHLP